MFVVQSSFSYIFRVGDGVANEALILCALHPHVALENKDEEWISEKRLPTSGERLRKPYINSIASVVEGAMYDLMAGAAGMPVNFAFRGLGKEERTSLNKKYSGKIAKFRDLLEDFQIHEFLGSDLAVYGQIKKLVRVQDSIHIDKSSLPYMKLNPEIHAYENLISAEKTAEFVLKCLDHNFSRNHKINPVPPISLPWDPHIQEVPTLHKYQPSK